MSTLIETTPIVTNNDNPTIIPTVSLGKSLSEKCLLVQIKIGSPVQSKKDQKASTNVANDNNANKNSVSVVKSLLRHKVMNDLQNAAQGLRLYAYTYTAPWDNNGQRIFKIAQFLKIKTELEKKRREYYDQVENVISNYPTMIEDDKKLLGDMFNLKDYPSANVLRSKLYATILISPVPKSDYRNNALENDDITRINNDIEERIASAIKEAAGDSLNRIKEKLDHLLIRLVDNKGKFHDSAVDNVIKEIDIVKDLIIDDNPVLLATLDQVREAINSQSPDVIRDRPKYRELAKQVTEAAIKEIDATMSGLF